MKIEESFLSSRIIRYSSLLMMLFSVLNNFVIWKNRLLDSRSVNLWPWLIMYTRCVISCLHFFTSIWGWLKKIPQKFKSILSFLSEILKSEGSQVHIHYIGIQTGNRGHNWDLHKHHSRMCGPIPPRVLRIYRRLSIHPRPP